MLTRICMRLRALFSNSYKFHLAGMSDGPAYLYLPAHPGPDASGVVSKTIRVRDLIGSYEGEDVNLDFDSEGRLIGIDVD
jgi:hypothetical protein